MSPPTLTFALAGSSGRLGSLLLQELSKKEKVSLLLLLRPSSPPPPAWLPPSVRTAIVDYNDVIALAQVLEGVHSVISALNGPPDVIFHVQEGLLQASLRAGVARFVPSDYTLDYRRLKADDVMLLSSRRRLAELLERHHDVIKAVHFLCGGFMDLLYLPFLGNFDLEAGRLSFWGTGDERFDVTSCADAARFVTEVLTSSGGAEAGWFEIVGQEVSFNELGDVFEGQSGRRLQRVAMGTLDEMLQESQKRKEQGNPSFVLLQFMHALLSKKGKLEHPCHARFLEKPPLSVQQFFNGKF